MKEKVIAEETIFELSGYILNCAEMVISPRGSPRYSALRFMAVFRRISELHKYIECLDKDPFLLELAEKLNKVPIESNNTDATRNGIQDLPLEFAVEANKRIE